MLLPYVAGLPFLNDEAIARVFGQTMAIRNWLDAIPTIPTLPEVILQKHRRTKEEQRAHWREKKREERRQKRAREYFEQLESLGYKVIVEPQK
jgi:hypothetical protein